MSVLIRSMKMPKYCIECIFCGSGSINEFEYWCGLTGSRLGAIGDIVLWEDMSAADCPLIEVPTPHGRLIDIETLKDDMAVLLERNGKLIDEWLAYRVEDTIDDQATIIEAEEGAEI